jgi:hypothetical protein
MDIDQNKDLTTLTEHSNAIRYLTRLSKSVTVMNPKFEFFGVKLTNAFDHFDAIAWRIAFVYISQVISKF